MRKITCAVLALTLLCSACSKTPVETLKAGTTMKEIYEKVDAQLGGAVTSPVNIDAAALADKFGIAESDLEEYYGQQSSTEADVLLCLKSKAGKGKSVKEAIDKYLATQKANFAENSTGSSFDRVQAGRTLAKDNCQFLIIVGKLPENPDSKPNFTADAQKAEEEINIFFAK